MILKESQLRNIIRRILFEKSDDDEKDKKDKKDVLGEPDQTMEPMRDDPEDDEKKDEVSTVGALGAAGTGPQPSGNIRGYVGPLGGGDQWNTVGVPGTKKKKKKKKWKVKK